MTVIVGSVIFAAVMIMISRLPVAYAMNQLGGYDNQQPREQQARLEGFGARALAAHQNTIEALPIFAAAVLLALWAQAPQAQLQVLCGVFMVARTAFLLCYWFDWSVVRSLVWVVGFVSSIWIMCLALP